MQAVTTAYIVPSSMDSALQARHVEGKCCNDLILLQRLDFGFKIKIVVISLPVGFSGVAYHFDLIFVCFP